MGTEYDRRLRALCAEIDAAQADIVLAVATSGEALEPPTTQLIDQARTRRQAADDALLAFLRDSGA